MQLLRAPFRNPLGQAVIALTDWIVKPLRKILPGFKGIDWASLVATVPVPVPVAAGATALVFGGLQPDSAPASPFLLVATVIALVKARAVAA